MSDDAVREADKIAANYVPWDGPGERLSRDIQVLITRAVERAVGEATRRDYTYGTVLRWQNIAEDHKQRADRLQAALAKHERVVEAMAEWARKSSRIGAVEGTSSTWRMLLLSDVIDYLAALDSEGRTCPICYHPIVTGKEACAMGVCPGLVARDE